MKVYRYVFDFLHMHTAFKNDSNNYVPAFQFIITHILLDNFQKGEKTVEYVFSTMFYFMRHTSRDIQSESLNALGFVCVRHYNFMLEYKLKNLYIDILSKDFYPTQHKTQVTSTNYYMIVYLKLHYSSHISKGFTDNKIPKSYFRFFAILNYTCKKKTFE